MFGIRSRSKGSGFAHKGRAKGQDAQVSTLTELGLLGPELPVPQSGGGGAWRTDFDRPNYPSHSGSATRPYPGGAPYGDKSRSTRFHGLGVELLLATACCLVTG